MSKIVFLTVPRSFVGDSCSFRKKFFYRNFLLLGGGYHDFLSKLLCLTLPKKIPKRTPLFQKISGSKNLHKMMYHDFVESCFSLSTENFSRGTLCLPEKLWYRKFWRIIGGYHYLPSKFFCLIVPENFVKEQFCVSENLWCRKFLCRRGGSRYCLGNFLSHSTKNFCRGHFCFRNFWIKKIA